MRSGLAKPCSSRGRWTAFPNATAGVRAALRRGIGEGDGLQGGAVLTGRGEAGTGLVEVPEVPTGRAESPRASRA